MILILPQEEALIRGQELENAVSDSDYAKAIQLAFELRRPHRLLDLFSLLHRYVISVLPFSSPFLIFFLGLLYQIMVPYRSGML